MYKTDLGGKSPLMQTVAKNCPKNKYLGSGSKWLSYNDQIGICEGDATELMQNGGRAHAKVHCNNITFLFH